MTPNDIANMADFIAQAIHKAAAEDESWGDLTAEEQDDFRVIAHAAMGAHDAWLHSAGFVIAKIKKRERKAIERPGLVDANGKPLEGRA